MLWIEVGFDLTIGTAEITVICKQLHYITLYDHIAADIVVPITIVNQGLPVLGSVNYIPCPPKKIPFLFFTLIPPFLGLTKLHLKINHYCMFLKTFF